LVPPLWTIDEILAATGGSVRGEPGDISGISIDSRTVEPGDLFIAIKGDQFDGHAFVDAALESGATAALVSAEQADGLTVPKGGLIIVRDSYDGLYDLARAARARATGKFSPLPVRSARHLPKRRFGSFCLRSARRTRR
jgi:UDP-N-acetylmuramoyl-tripeptide--D-alanyl-D-alanine ligase